jgi:hypothetical protein
MTAEQIQMVLKNMVQRPRSHAPVIYQAIRNNKPGTRPGLHCPVAGQPNEKGDRYG